MTHYGSGLDRLAAAAAAAAAAWHLAAGGTLFD